MGENLLEELLLDQCADTYVGGERMSGISGGEKKRTSVGAELVTDPNCLFLDEPTSGLDSFAAHTVISILKRICVARNIPIICTIHQPSSEVFSLFDKLLLLNRGQVIFNDTTKSLPGYFARVGHTIPMNFNPADHILFVAQKATHEEHHALVAEWMTIQKERENMIMEKRTAEAQNSASRRNLITQQRMKPFPTQLYHLSVREFRDVTRNTLGLFIRLFVAGFINALIAVIFKDQAKNSNPMSYTGHLGALLNLAIGAMFGAANPIMLTFDNERGIFLREYLVKSYGVTAWMVSKTLFEIPVTILVETEVICITYWLVGFQAEIYWLIGGLSMLGMSAASVSLLFGCTGPDARASLEASPLIFVPQFLFAGFFVPIKQIPQGIRWASWACFMKYAMNFLVIVEFRDAYKDLPRVDQRAWVDLDVEENDWTWSLYALIGFIVVTRCFAMLAIRWQSQVVF